MKKKALALILSAAMVLSLAACGGNGGGSSSEQQPSAPSSQESTPSSEAAPSEESSEPAGGEDTADVPAEPVVIRYGTHWINGLDPNYVDEVTGEYTMEESPRQAALVALQAVKDQLNVEIQFLQYPVDVQTDLMTSVLAGDPICDLALLWAGVEPTILSQNVLQDLTPYKDLFEGNEWHLKDPMFGGYYLMNDEFGMTYFPLVVNLTMLEKVDSLKDENGKTIYPMDLFEEGNWTWSTFKDYLSKVQAYYGGMDAVDGAKVDTMCAYETDHRFAALAAIHANGGGIFVDGQVAADSQEAIEGVNFIKELMDAELLVDCGYYDDGYTPQWCEGGNDFGRGNTVFTECPGWQIKSAASSCAERGENIGIIPWPRPDDMAFDDPAYMQSNNGGNSVAILKGVSEEKTRLAIQAYILYWNTYYQALGGVENAEDYPSATAETELVDRGVDIYNEEYGQSLIDCYKYILTHMNTNYAGSMGLWEHDAWTEILGKSLLGLEGMSSYDVAIKANLSILSNKMDTIAAALQSGEVHDTYAPTMTSNDAVLEAGTDPASVDWTQYFTAEDTVDGVLTITADNITVSEDLDLATPGQYDGAVKAEVADSSDNKSNKSIKVVVYDASNTTAPTVEAAEELPTVALNTETSSIDWGSFLASATDADGLDVKSSATADLSTLDTTTPGTYDVTLTVTDYAGNTAQVTVSVEVVSE